MSNTFFQFKQFVVHQEHCAMKVCTDACILGAWTASITNYPTDSGKRILDIGTGTGLLSLLLAQKLEGKIEAIEINEKAAAQAKENVERSPWANRITVTHSSLQDHVPKSSYDLVISNPPFFENDLPSNDHSVNQARHQHTLSLDTLLGYIAKYLSPTGAACLLIPFYRETYFIAEAKKHGLYVQQIVRLRQTPAHTYFRSLIQVSRERTGLVVQSEWSIHTEERNYTDSFIQLLKEYYLHL